MRRAGFLHEPATKRDLVAGSSVLAVLVVVAILGAVVTAIRLHEALDEARGRLDVEHAERLEVERANKALEGELVSVREATASAVAAVEAQAAEQVSSLRRRVVVLEESPVSGVVSPSESLRGPGATPSPSSAAPPAGGPVSAPGPPPASGGTPAPRSRPERPSRPRPPRVAPPIAEPPPVVAPPIALPPRPAPPVVAPPIAPTPAPPRPGNKPPGAPCPPRNPNCG